MPEIKKFLDDNQLTEQLIMAINMLNTTYMKEQLVELDKEMDIDGMGEKVANGEIAEVVNGVVNRVIAKEEGKSSYWTTNNNTTTAQQRHGVVSTLCFGLKSYMTRNNVNTPYLICIWSV